MMTDVAKPFVFFDRDGIVNEAPVTRYVERLSDFHLLPDFFRALQVVIECGYEAVIITNQKGVSTGKIPLEELNAMHSSLRTEVTRRGLRLLDIFYCDAAEDDHPRRKPNPGMLVEAAEKYHVDLARSWMIGDNESDVLTGQRAGCRTIYVGVKKLKLVPEFSISSMQELPALLEKILPSPEH